VYRKREACEQISSDAKKVPAAVGTFFSFLEISSHGSERRHMMVRPDIEDLLRPFEFSQPTEGKVSTVDSVCAWGWPGRPELL